MSYTNSQIPIEIKQKKLRQAIPQSEFQQFGQFCLQKYGNIQIQNWSLSFIEKIIEQYQVDKRHQQDQFLNDNPFERSFAQYQIASEKPTKKIIKQQKQNPNANTNMKKHKQTKQESIIAEAYDQSQTERYHEINIFQDNIKKMNHYQYNTKQATKIKVQQSPTQSEQIYHYNRQEQKKKKNNLYDQQSRKQQAKQLQAKKQQIRRQQVRKQQAKLSQIKEQDRIKKQLQQIQQQKSLLKQLKIFQQVPNTQRHPETVKLGMPNQNRMENNKNFTATTTLKKESNSKTTNELIDMLLSPEIEYKNKNEINQKFFKTQPINSMMLSSSSSNFWDVPEPVPKKQPSKKFLQFDQFQRLMVQRSKAQNNNEIPHQPTYKSTLIQQSQKTQQNTKKILNFDDIIIDQLTPEPTQYRKAQHLNVEKYGKIQKEKKKSLDTRNIPQRQQKIKTEGTSHSKMTKTSQKINKRQKTPYQGPVIFREKFQDSIPCFKSPIRKQLYNPSLKVHIINHQIIQRGFFSSDYVMYTLKLQPGNIQCKRNYEDFQKLQNTLVRIYPGMQIPYLQGKSWFSETNAENIKRQKIFLQFFLNDLLQNPELRNLRVIEDFLTIPEHKKMKRKFQQYEKLQKLVGIQNLCMIDGTVPVQISQETRIYEQLVSKFLYSIQHLMDRHRGLCDTLLIQYQAMLSTLNNLSNLMKQMETETRNFNNRVPFHEIQNLENVYNKLHRAYKYEYAYKKFQSNQLQEKIIPFLKYERDNISTLQNLIYTRNLFTKHYLKRLETEPLGSAAYTNEKLNQYKTGILEESKNLTILKYQVGYLNNQVCSESQRVFQLMGKKFEQKWNYLADKYSQHLKENLGLWSSIKIQQ